MVLGDEIDEAATFEVLDHAAVAVQKYDGIACAALDIMEPHAVHFEETARRRIVPLGLLFEVPVKQSSGNQSRYRDRGGGYHGCSGMATGREGSANSLDGTGWVHGSRLGRRLHEIQMVLRNVAARNEHAAQPIVPKTCIAKRRAVLPILLRRESRAVNSGVA